MRQNYSCQVEATLSRLVNLHQGASHTCLSLGYFIRNNVALEGVDHFFFFLWRIGQGEVQGHQAPLKNAKPARQLHPLPERSHLRMCGVKPRMLWGLAAMVLEGNPNHALLDPHAQGSA